MIALHQLTDTVNICRVNLEQTSSFTHNKSFRLDVTDNFFEGRTNLYPALDTMLKTWAKHIVSTRRSGEFAPCLKHFRAGEKQCLFFRPK